MSLLRFCLMLLVCASIAACVPSGGRGSGGDDDAGMSRTDGGEGEGEGEGEGDSQVHSE